MGPELWTPRENLRNLVSLYEADFLTGYADGNTINPWPDRVTEGNDLSVGTGPTYKENIINGLPIARYNGTSQGLRTSGHVAHAAGDWSFFFVVNPVVVGVGASQYLWDTQTGRMICILNHTGDGNVRFFYGTIGRVFGAAVTGWQVLVFTAAVSPGVSLHRNGTQVGSTQVYAATAISASVGLGIQYPGGGAWLNGDLLAAGVVKGGVTAAVRQQIEGWALHKIGLQASLPGGHPYLTDPPMIDAWRSQLYWRVGELHRAGKLNAHNLLCGRTRLLAESLPGHVYTAATTPISVHAQRVRGGFVTFTASVVLTGLEHLYFRVVRDSDSAVLQEFDRTAGLTNAITQTLECPVDVEVRLEVEITGASTVQDIQISETPGPTIVQGSHTTQVDMGAWTGIADAEFVQSAGEQVWKHRDEADSTPYNDTMVTPLPLGQMIGRQKNEDEQSTTATVYTEIFRVRADKLLGSQVFAICLGRATAAETLDVEVGLYDGVTFQRIGGTGNTSSTSNVPVTAGGAVPAAVIGVTTTLAVRIKSNGGAAVYVSGIKLYSGTKATAAGYLT